MKNYKETKNKSIEDIVLGRIARNSLKWIVPSTASLYLSLPKMMMYSRIEEGPDWPTAVLMGAGLLGISLGGFFMAGAYNYLYMKEKVEKEYESKS